jgi:hypothetical protein
MLINKYEQLGICNKINILREKGQYLVHLEMLEQVFILFKLWDFYVEVCYDSTTQTISGLRAFNDRGGLAPYLDVLNSAPSD